MTLQIGSKEHFKESSNTGETWHIPTVDFTKRAAMTLAVLQNLSHVLNSGEFIIRQLYDINLKVSKVLMTGQKIFGDEKEKSQFYKESSRSTLSCTHSKP